MSRDPAYLLDILKAARLVQEFVVGTDKAAFDNDLKTQHAVIRQLEIIGEATRRLSPAFRTSHPEIPWQLMAGMRSVLIHDYDQVDMDDVWNTVANDIPALIAQIEPLTQSGNPEQ